MDFIYEHLSSKGKQILCKKSWKTVLMNINASKCLKHNGGETTCPFGLFVTFKGAPSMSTVFNFMLKCYSNIWPSRVYYQKSSKVMHEFRSCELLLPWRLKTNDLRNYLHEVIKRYFFASLFFFMNFAICRLMTCLPLGWKNDQVDRKERIGCNCNVRFVTMRKNYTQLFFRERPWVFLTQWSKFVIFIALKNCEIQREKESNEKVLLDDPL